MPGEEGAEFCPLTASNYVCTADLMAPVDIQYLTLLLEGRSSHVVFPSAVIYIRNPRVVFQVFKTGCIVISGAASKLHAILAVHKLVDFLSYCTRQQFYVHRFSVQNIVAFGGLGFFFNQSLFHEDHPMVISSVPAAAEATPQSDATAKKVKKKKKNMEGLRYSEYQPAQFRGLQFYDCYPRVCVLFRSGKYVVTGCNNEEQIVQSIQSVDFSKYELGREYRAFDESKAKLRAIDLVRPKKKTARPTTTIRPTVPLWKMLWNVQQATLWQMLDDVQDLAEAADSRHKQSNVTERTISNASGLARQ
jgi:TATA-box binding protein (TBP) (component of TFIID and TFIIIB)